MRDVRNNAIRTSYRRTHGGRYRVKDTDSSISNTSPNQPPVHVRDTKLGGVTLLDNEVKLERESFSQIMYIEVLVFVGR